MTLLDDKITQKLESLSRLSSSDFSSLAIMESNAPHARWRNAFGNLSERYRHMTLKHGMGPAGLALRIGKPVKWDESIAPNPGIRTECPLMKAEQLFSATAYPISKDNRIKAVLLMARRSTIPYTESEMIEIQNNMNPLILLIHESE